ncbi:MAG: zinc carboxypeptidase, partial [Bdellovibrionota bacterium]
ETVRKNVMKSDFALSLDIHSGFGMRDRVWYPWSGSKKMIPDQVTIEKIEEVFRSSHPFHFYKIEPQTSSYVIHGDPWDYLYDESLKTRKTGQVYLPLALEMGSWTWLRKNPGQFFRRDGIYNPIIPHRYNRIMRRHRPMLDFLLHMIANHNSVFKAQ